MKKLVAISILGLALAFPSLSFAQGYVFGVKTPVVKNDVGDVVRGGKVERDFISFYTTPKGDNQISSAPANPLSGDKDSYIVFGVKLQRTTEI